MKTFCWLSSLLINWHDKPSVTIACTKLSSFLQFILKSHYRFQVHLSIDAKVSKDLLNICFNQINGLVERLNRAAGIS